MSSVDHRIVEMEFDNKDFEKRVSTTINSIDELKKSLNFNGVEKGFDNVSKGFAGLGIEKVSSALDAVTNKFSIFGTIGDQVIRNLTNSITNKLMAAFKEVEGMITGSKYMMEGFKEYEIKIGSIQTIAANTGALSNLNKELKESVEYSEEELKVVQDVIAGVYSAGDERRKLLEEANYDYEKIQNKVNQIMAGVDDTSTEIGNNVTTTIADIDAALDDLNVYADKTIYSFSQMTQAIGKFTTAGIDLETSTNLAKSISNLAAYSGADNAANQRAMYNLSQSMQAGYLMTQDFNSLVLAGMGNATFQQQLIETARIHGVAIDQMIEDEGNLKDTLKEKWATNDILIETLSKFSAFTEDMTEEEREAERATWREIGYTEEQIAAIEDLSRVAYDAATKVRTFSQLVDTTKEEIGSSYTMMWQNIIGNFDEATELWTSIHDAIQEHFITPMTQARDAKWKFFHDNGGREAAIEGLTNIGKGLLTIIHAITDAWHEVFPPDDGHRITAMAKAFAEFSKRLVVSEETAEKIKMTFKGLFSVLHIFTTGIRIAVKVIAAIIKALTNLGSAGHPILDLTSRIGALLVELDHFISDADNIETAISKITAVLRMLWSVIEPLGDKIADLFKSAIAPKFEKTFTELRGFVKKFVKGSSEDVNSIQNEDVSGVKSFGDKVKDAIGPVLEKLEPLFNIGKKILNVYIKVWKVIISWCKDAFYQIKTIISENAENVSLSTLFELILGAEAFTMLRSIKKFFDTAQKSLGNISGVINNINGVLTGVKDVLQAYALDIKANVLLKIATAVLMLCGSLIALSQIDTDKLWAALGAMSALMAELMIFTVVIGKLVEGTTVDVGKGGIGANISSVSSVIMSIALSVIMLAGAIYILGMLDAEKMATGLANMAYVLAMMIGVVLAFNKLMNKDMAKSIMAAGFAMTEMALAINMMLIPLIILSLIPSDIIGRGLTMLIGLMSILVGSILALAGIMKLSNAKSIMAVGVAIIALATAINMLVIPITILGLLPDKILAKGLASVIGLLAMLAIAVIGLGAAMKLSTPSGIMATAVAILGLVTAINMLVIPITILGLLPVDVITRGMITLGAALFGVWLFMKTLPKDHENLAKALMAIAMDMVIIAGALILLAPINWKQLLTASGSMSLVLGLLAVMLSQIPDNKNVAKILQSIAICIGVLAVSLMALSNIDEHSLTCAVVALSVMMLALIALMYVIGKSIAVQAGLTKLTNSILNFATSIALIGGGFFAFAAAMVMLSKIDGDNFKKVGKGLAELITALVVGLLEGIEEVGAALVVALPRFASFILAGIVEVFKRIAEYLPDFINTACNIVVAIFRGIQDNAGILVEELILAIIAIFDAVSTWLSTEDNADMLAQSIMNLLATVFALTMLLCSKFVDVGIEILKNIAIGIDSWYGGTPLYDFFYSGKGQDFMKEVYEGFQHIIDLGGFGDLGKYITKFISDGIMDPDAIRALIKAMKDILSPISRVFHFFNIETPLDKAIDEISELLLPKNSVKTSTDEYKKWLDSLDPAKDMAEATQKIKKAQQEARNLYNGVDISWYRNIEKEDSKQAAKEIAESRLTAMDEAGRRTARAYLDAFEEEAGINSPSKAMEEDTDYLFAGAEESFKKHKDDFTNSATSMFKNSEHNIFSSDAFKSLKNRFASEESDLFDSADLSSLTTGEVKDLDDLNKTYNWDTTSTVDLNDTLKLQNTDLTGQMALDVSDQMSDYQEKIVENTTNIYNELASLRGYISEIKIQLDSGALVGSLVGPMDTALGERSNMKARGV